MKKIEEEKTLHYGMNKEDREDKGRENTDHLDSLAGQLFISTSGSSTRSVWDQSQGSYQHYFCTGRGVKGEPCNGSLGDSFSFWFYMNRVEEGRREFKL